METVIQIAPFHIHLEPTRAVFRFAEIDELSQDFPSNLESLIRGMIERDELRLLGHAVSVDLATVRAISSRQLGSLLAVHRVLCPDGKLSILNVGRNVRQLFDMTHMSTFFDY